MAHFFFLELYTMSQLRIECRIALYLIQSQRMGFSALFGAPIVFQIKNMQQHLTLQARRIYIFTF